MLLTEPMLEVTRDRLRTKLANVMLPKISIRITNEERVPPEAGEEFINLYGAESTNLYPPENPVRVEQYSFKIGITRRFIGIPIHNTAEGIYTYDQELISRLKKSMAMRAYEIMSTIDGSWYIVNSIKNKTELSNISFCILTPLGYTGSDPLVEVSADHFYTEAEDEQAVGLFLSLNFVGLQTYFDKYER